MNEINQQLNTTQIKDQVFDRITSEQITPTPRWRFLYKEYLVWVAWVFSIVLGAFAVAIVEYVLTTANTEFFQITHNSYWNFLLYVLPYLWLVILMVMASLAYFNFRRTKTGYRYSILFVLISSLMASLVGGTLLNMAGFGYTLDTAFGDRMSMYYSLEKKERALWQAPKEGRLVGVYYISTSTKNLPQLRDTTGEVWTLNVDDLHKMDMSTLESGGAVRVLGFAPEAMPGLFHACGVFPWMYDEPSNFVVMKQAREDFIERMYAHTNVAVERLEVLEAVTYSTTSGRMPMGVCATHEAIERISSLRD